MDEIINRITVDQLKENPPVITKKFLLVDSSLYTNEAYEYLLEIINETDSIAFIRDLKKIYTHGEYFGGDIWEESLFYFGSFQILDNESEEVLTNLEAEIRNETLRLKGINNIKLIPEIEWSNGVKYKTIKIGYNIDNSIDKTPVTIDDNTAQYNLEIKDNKISVNKYIPIRIEAPKLNLIEYDTEIESLEFNINIFGNDDDKRVVITSDQAIVNLSDDFRTVYTNILRPNATIEYLVLYSDSKTQGAMNIYQKYGFANIYSVNQITKENFNLFDKYISEDSCQGEFTLDIPDDQYGWFACPSFLKPKFIDKDTNICGGWEQHSYIYLYSLNMEYIVYKTVNSGLGLTNWKVIE